MLSNIMIIHSASSVFIKQGSPMLLPAHKYLTLRALGAPAVLLSLAMQGVFRGFKDTKTPLYATGIFTYIMLSYSMAYFLRIIFQHILFFVFSGRRCS